METKKWKAKGDLFTFAAEHPGALSGYFLAMIYSRMGGGTVTSTRDLKQASVMGWVEKYGGVSETRDVREMTTLAYAMDLVNKKQMAEVMDVLAQRILSIQNAKKKGGSWEKAEAIELTPSSGAGATSNPLLRLMA